MQCGDLQGHVTEVPLDYFKSSVLPALPRTDLDNIQSAVAHLVKDNRWSAFPLNPAEDRKTENNIFAPLPAVLNDIIKATAKVLNHEVEDAMWGVVARPNETLNSENGLHASFKPDAAAMLRRPRGPGSLARRGRNPSEQPAPSISIMKTRSSDKLPHAVLSRNASDAVWLAEFKTSTRINDILDVSIHLLV